MFVRDVCNYLEEKYPKINAEDFDQPRIGLTIGSENIEVKNILFSLDLNEEVVDEAIKKDCNLIITHHPYIFDPLYKVIFESEKGRVIRKMFENNISTFSMHTNLDVGEEGVNDTLIKVLGVYDYKVINDEKVKGNYLRYGNIEEVSLKDLALNVKEKFKLSGVKVYGDFDKKIKSIGVVGGSGAHMFDIINALKCNIDCFITGEIKLNIAQFADYNGLSLIEVNHGVEKFVFEPLKNTMENDLKKKCGFENSMFVSLVETDKFKSL